MHGQNKFVAFSSSNPITILTTYYVLTYSETHLLRVNPLGHELSFDEGSDLGLLAGEPGHPLSGLVEAEVAHEEGRRYLWVVEVHACGCKRYPEQCACLPSIFK